MDVVACSTTAVADGICFGDGGVWFCDVDDCRGHGCWFSVVEN